jgi:hypothetical protein
LLIREAKRDRRLFFGVKFEFVFQPIRFVNVSQMSLPNHSQATNQTLLKCVETQSVIGWVVSRDTLSAFIWLKYHIEIFPTKIRLELPQDILLLPSFVSGCKIRSETKWLMNRLATLSSYFTSLLPLACYCEYNSSHSPATGRHSCHSLVTANITPLTLPQLDVTPATLLLPRI